MSNTSLNSKGFKWTLSSLGGVIALLVFATPYLNITAQQSSQAAETKELKKNQVQDHDTLIRLESDVRYIRENVNDIKILLQQKQRTEQK